MTAPLDRAAWTDVQVQDAELGGPAGQLSARWGERHCTLKRHRKGPWEALRWFQHPKSPQ